MIIAKLVMQMEVAVALPLPGTTKEEAEAALLSDESKEEFASFALKEMKEQAKASGADIKLLSTELSVGEV